MCTEVGELLLDLGWLRPDAAVDEIFLKIRQVHYSGEVLTEAHGIDDRKLEFSRRRRGEQAQQHLVERCRRRIGARPPGFEQQRTGAGIGQHQRQSELRWTWQNREILGQTAT
jgi:hypothetical protein